MSVKKFIAGFLLFAPFTGLAASEYDSPSAVAAGIIGSAAHAGTYEVSFKKLFTSADSFGQDMYKFTYERLKYQAADQAVAKSLKAFGGPKEELLHFVNGETVDEALRRANALTKLSPEQIERRRSEMETLLTEEKELADLELFGTLESEPKEIFANGDESDSGFDLLVDLERLEAIHFGQTETHFSQAGTGVPIGGTVVDLPFPGGIGGASGTGAESSAGGSGGSGGAAESGDSASGSGSAGTTAPSGAVNNAVDAGGDGGSGGAPGGGDRGIDGSAGGGGETGASGGGSGGGSGSGAGSSGSSSDSAGNTTGSSFSGGANPQNPFACPLNPDFNAEVLSAFEGSAGGTSGGGAADGAGGGSGSGGSFGGGAGASDSGGAGSPDTDGSAGNSPGSGSGGGSSGPSSGSGVGGSQGGTPPPQASGASQNTDRIEPEQPADWKLPSLCNKIFCLKIERLSRQDTSFIAADNSIQLHIRKINEAFRQTLEHNLVPSKATGNLMEGSKCKKALFNSLQWSLTLIPKPILTPPNDDLVTRESFFGNLSILSQKYDPAPTEADQRNTVNQTTDETDPQALINEIDALSVAKAREAEKTLYEARMTAQATGQAAEFKALIVELSAMRAYFESFMKLYREMVSGNDDSPCKALLQKPLCSQL